MAHLRFYELSDYKLGTCANEMDITISQAHRALPDKIGNAKFLVRMLKDFRGEGKASGKAYKRREYTTNF